jgi:hypothetical protein
VGTSTTVDKLLLNSGFMLPPRGMRKRPKASAVDRPKPAMQAMAASVLSENLMIKAANKSVSLVVNNVSLAIDGPVQGRLTEGTRMPGNRGQPGWFGQQQASLMLDVPPCCDLVADPKICTVSHHVLPSVVSSKCVQSHRQRTDRHNQKPLCRTDVVMSQFLSWNV